MKNQTPGASLQLRSVVTPEGQVELSLSPVPVESLKAMQSRGDAPMRVGLEGAGTTVAAGSSHAAQSLMGRTVAAMAGGMYARYRCIPAAKCLVLPEGTSAAQAASCFVNPLAALGMIETARSERHTAIVQTAAASNLGQILLRVCLADDIPLVNVVRSEQKVGLLREQGARYVCNSSSDHFREQLIDAIAATGATIALDLIGGAAGGQILSCMEAAIRRRPGQVVTRFGSEVLKQLYVYGTLDPRPIEIPRDIGTAWAAGGWLVLRYLKVAQRKTLDGLKAPGCFRAHNHICEPIQPMCFAGRGHLTRSTQGVRTSRNGNEILDRAVEKLLIEPSETLISNSLTLRAHCIRCRELNISRVRAPRLRRRSLRGHDRA